MTLKVKIGSAYRYLVENGGITHTESARLKHKIIRLISLGLVNGDSSEVDIESLKKYLEYESDINKSYMSLKEFVEVVKIRSTNDMVYGLKRRLKELGSESPFECINLSYPINLQTLFLSRLSVKRFLKDYRPFEELKRKNDYSSGSWTRILKKFGIRPLILTSENQFITKLEFKTLEIYFASKLTINKEELTSLPEEINLVNYLTDDYYSLEETKRILSLKVIKHFPLILEEYKPSFKVAKDGRKYFKKDDIDRLKTIQIGLREKYISAEEAKERAASEGFHFQEDYIQGEPIDSLLRPLFFKHKKSMYPKDAFNKWLEERRTKSEFFSISMESDFNTFKYRLRIKDVDINNFGPFTSETWLHFISSKLKQSKAKPQTVDRNIISYVYCTERLINLVSSTKSHEIYSITSNDINTLFNEIPKRDSLVIYLYLKQVYNQLKIKKMKAFDIKKVYDPNKFKKESQEKSIYEYEVYKQVYNYAKDISLHINKAINEVLKEISSKGGKGNAKYYASSWLYVLLHLNNAWRHTDVISFPQVNLAGTKIRDLHWMLENKLDPEDIDYIINQVYRTEFIISKTHVKNYFFCSKELKEAFATAIAICQLRTTALYPLNISIIDFGNKKKTFSDSLRKDFFESFVNKEFYFSSRKMNRSLMTFIYVLLSKMQKGTEGLETIQKMRGHLWMETTNIYVEIPEEELNFLTHQLFARGSFGFIYDTFLDVLQGREIDREKRTTEIQYLGKYFGGLYKIEEISSFLNVIQSDRKAILERILSMGLDEAISFVNKIHTNELPSKQDNIQCLVGESGCVKKGKDVNCFDCAYSIPNYYALSSLGASIQDRLNSYLDSRQKGSGILYYEQRKRARLFYIQLEIFAQAIQRFGWDVYDFINDSREEFIEKQSKISSLMEQFELI